MAELKAPLGLRYNHGSYEGFPMPVFITAERMKEVTTQHKNRPGDVYIATYQKSGTTWLQQILCLMHDFPQGKEQANIMFDIPWLEKESAETINKAISPRILKTHLKWRWVPKGDEVKYIYSYRNPKDVVTSYYHHTQWIKAFYDFQGTFNDFVADVFLAENGSEFGTYFDHVAGWLGQKENKNILYVTYEDMSEDLAREVRRIAAFLGIELSDEKLDWIVNGSGFETMQKNNRTNYTWFPGTDPNLKFIRKGKVGDWKSQMTAEHSEEIEERVNKTLIPLGAKIRYELD